MLPRRTRHVQAVAAGYQTCPPTPLADRHGTSRRLDHLHNFMIIGCLDAWMLEMDAWMHCLKKNKKEYLGLTHPLW